MSKSVPRRSRLQPCVIGCLLAVLVVSLAPAGIARAEEPRPATQLVACGRLDPGAPVEREIKEGERHAFQIEATAGDYLGITVDQRGINLVAGVYGPDRSLLLEISRTSDARDVERVEVVVLSSGAYTLELVSTRPNITHGRYVVSVDARRPATPQDRTRAETRARLAEAYRLWGWKEDKDLDRKLTAELERARLVYHDLGDFADEAQLLGEAADIHYYNLGEMQRGIDEWDRMVELARRTNDRRLLVHSLFERGWAAFNMGDFEMRTRCYLEAHRLSEALDNPYLRSKAIEGLGHITHRVNVDETIKYYMEALEIHSGLLSDCACRRLLNNLGIHWSLKKDYARAVEYLERAIAADRTCGGDTDGVYARLLLANVYCDAGFHAKAIPLYEQALEAGSGLLNDGRRDTLIRLADCESDVGHYDRAREYAEEALRLLEGNLDSLSNESLRFAMSHFKSRFYGVYTGILLRMHRENPSAGYDAEAFSASEEARARQLLLALALAGPDIGGSVDSRLVDRERELRARIDSALEERIRLLNLKESDPECEATAARTMTELKAEYESVQSRIQDQSPFFASSRTRPLEVAEIQDRLLDDDTLLLEYLIGYGRGYVFAVTKTSLKIYELSKHDEIDAAAEAMRRGMAGTETEEYERAAATLSRLVLGPVAAELGTKRLAIVPDLTLSLIPFAALPDPNSTSGEPLVVRHEVTMLPSATAAVFQRERIQSRRPAPKSVAVLADPIFARTDTRIRPRTRGDRASGTSATRREQGVSRTKAEPVGSDLTRARASWEAAGLVRKGEEFARLPWTRLEAKRIVGAAPRGTTFSALDFAASESTVEGSALGQYRVLHFATHGFLDATQPELSGLVLTLVNERGEPEDGFLSVPEVFNLKLPAELVVLSGCETALGKQVAGEGMVGLTRAFMYAGVPRAIASLWAVQDEATAELMGRMYEGIYGRGLTPAAALREAQVAMWRDPRWRAPRKWAAFVHQGDWLCPKL